MKKYITCLSLLYSYELQACPVCNTATGIQVRETIFNSHFFFTLINVLTPFIIFILFSLTLHYYPNIKKKVYQLFPGYLFFKKGSLIINRRNRLLVTAGIFLGSGIGGFIDGILFHQVLQLHNMLSNSILPFSVVNIEINMFWDGIFHIFTLMMLIIGLVLLWQVAKNPTLTRSNKILFGGISLGFGVFNLIEGLINHHLYQLHHVIQQATTYHQVLGDIFYLLSGLLLIVLGIFLIRHSGRSELSYSSKSR